MSPVLFDALLNIFLSELGRMIIIYYLKYLMSNMKHVFSTRASFSTIFGDLTIAFRCIFLKNGALL